jgi:DNA-binding LytR/AlgR family response regulator
MITIFVCDDEASEIEKYNKRLNSLAKKHGEQISLLSFDSGEKLIRYFDFSRNWPNIIYLDILMKEIDGIETAKYIRKLGCEASIVFLTSYGDYVYDSFEISPIQYLLKTEFSTEKFEKVFLRAVTNVKKCSARMFKCVYGNSIKMIPTGEILFFEIIKRIVTVHYGKNEKFNYYITLAELEEQTEGLNFFRVHRSYIVNMRYITNFKSKSLTLSNGVEIPIGVTYMDKLKQAFSAYIGEVDGIYS